MATTHRKIRNSDKAPSYESIQPVASGSTYSLMLEHPATNVMSAGGIMAAGIDVRPSWCIWGEGPSPTHLLFYVVDGCVATEDEQGTAAKNQVICLPAQVPKRLQAYNESVTAVWAHVNDTAPWNLLRRQAYTCIEARETQLLYNLMAALLRETITNTPESVEATEQMSRLFLHYLHRQVHTKSDPLDETVREKLLEIWQAVSTAIQEKWSVHRLSEMACMSEGHFHRETVRLFGEQPMQIVRRIRMERAASLLKTTALNLDTIAERVGYSTAYAFSNAFFKQMGMRPGRYRHQLKET